MASLLLLPRLLLLPLLRRRLLRSSSHRVPVDQSRTTQDSRLQLALKRWQKQGRAREEWGRGTQSISTINHQSFIAVFSSHLRLSFDLTSRIRDDVEVLVHLRDEALLVKLWLHDRRLLLHRKGRFDDHLDSFVPRE